MENWKSPTRKFGRLLLSSSPTPPSRNPTHVSSSPMTAINLERWAYVIFQIRPLKYMTIRARTGIPGFLSPTGIPGDCIFPAGEY